jgi:protein ImuB
MVDRTSEALAIHASRELPGGTTRLEAIEGVVRLLLTEVSAALAAHESGLRRLDARFERMNLGPEVMTVQVSRPTRDEAHLWSLLRPKVERLQMGFGVERVTLCVGGIARLVHRQVSLAGEAENAWKHDGEFAAMLDTLAARLGRTNVLRAELTPSHRPERAFRLVAFDEVVGAAAPVRASAGPRPSRLFDPPCPAEVVALHPGGPVCQVRWRGQGLAILTSVGPERIGPEWWKGREPTREYYRVQDEEGRWLWIFREATAARWFVHGEWC